jgi:oxepin-CoA hydrolase/3-oxo-5,6-dehydrosuberyl-CoA semialdehyde dehydrogenase
MTEPLKLASYGAGRWTAEGTSEELISAIDGSVVALMPGDYADPGEMIRYARDIGGPGLRQLSFQERGKLLRGLADAIIARKEELYDLSYATGATRADSWLDIEGGAGVLFVYASKAKALTGNDVLIDGERETITKGNFAGLHILSPMRGAAVHINAYNFPVWGMLEKLGPTILAGMPAIVKPAGVTAWLAHAAFRIMIESGLLPPGALQLLLGPVGNLLDQVDGQDVVAFTGSAATAAKLRAHPRLIREGTRFTAEQDSLNASILGPDAVAETPEFDLFVKEVVREMTIKAGQKCTAIRRAIVPKASIDQVQAAIAKRLAGVKIGDPRDEGTRMGALAGIKQREDVLANLSRLSAEATAVPGTDAQGAVSFDMTHGAFTTPTLLRCDRPMQATLVHEVEAFGPVATLMPYSDVAEAAELARRGKGSLVLSLFSFDAGVVAGIVRGTASSHGRLALIDRDSAADSTGHGSALPHLVHGGPGRAGGGEELGGLIGMKHYMQRTAVQASAAVLDQVAGL